jgi:hypothetical protein
VRKEDRNVTAPIKKAFPRLPFLLLLDGLYPNGPIMERRRRYRWDFVIALNLGVGAS